MKATNTERQPADLKSIKILAAAEFADLDKLIIRSLSSDIPLINSIVNHILRSGGKRLRPLIILLLAKCLHSHNIPEHIELACFIEFVHTATLLHDDVIDNSSLRRGQKTANQIWGQAAPVLIGDFLYSRAFQLIAQSNNPSLMRTLSEATNLIAEGEIIQLSNQGQLISKQQYFEVIYRKTAALFATACESTAIISQLPAEQKLACKHFGTHLGIAFQIVDDMLDYTANSELLGKNMGDDLKEGKMTLPLIYAYENAESAEQLIIKNAIEKREGNTQNIVDIIEQTNAIPACQTDLTCQYNLACQAIAAIGPADQTQPLKQLLDFAVERVY